MSPQGATRRSTGDAAVRSGDRLVTPEALFERAARAASGLAATGLAEGGTVAVLLRNDLPFLECMVATATAGAYCVPINWHYTTEEVAYILADTRPTHLVVHADLLPAVRASVPVDTTVLAVPTPPEIAEAYGLRAASAGSDDGIATWDAWLQQWPPWKGSPAAMRGSMIYTSGPTGLPKAVRREPVPAEQREAYARLRAEWFGHRAGMRTAIIGPLYHSVQATYAYSALQVGGTVILVPRFDAESLLALVAKERLTHLHLVPTMMHRLVQLDESLRRRYDLSSLEYVIHGAAPCPPDVKRRLIEWWGPIVHEYYGTSETGMVTRSSSAEWLSRPGTVGQPCPGRVVRIYDDAGGEVSAGTEGTIYMNLGMVPDFTYHGAEDKRAAIERDGLVTTGDVGYVDRDGFLFLCDRRQDVVISGGVKIWPAEVEAVLATHAAVADCAVFAIPDAEFGQVPAAVVQPVAGSAVTAEEIRQFLLLRLAKFKVPRHLEIRDSLPRDDSGKIFKRLLRDAYAGAANRR
jgi:long-chain acyl-CoA synthetase